MTSTKQTEEQQLLAALQTNSVGVERVQQLLKLGNYYLTKDGEEKTDIDKALMYGANARQLASDLNYSQGIDDALQLLGHSYIESGDRGAAARIAQQANKKTKMRLFYIYSLYHRYGGVKAAIADSAIHYALLSKMIATELNNGEYFIKNSTELIIVYANQRRYAEAEQQAEELDRKNIAGKKDLHYAYNILSEMNQDLGNYNKALGYSLRAIQNMHEVQDFIAGGRYYSSLGAIYRNTGQFRKSIEAYEQAGTFYRQVSGKEWLWLIQNEITGVYIKMARYEEAITGLVKLQTDYPARNTSDSISMHKAFASCYRLLKQYDRATPHFEKLVAITKTWKYDEDLYKYIGQHYTEMGRYREAKPFLEEVLKNTSHKTPVLLKGHLRFLLFRVDSALGNCQSAIDHLIVNKAMDDSIYQLDKIRQVRELQTKYETDRKDRELEFGKQHILLLQRQAELKQKDFDQTRFRLEYETKSNEQGMRLAKAESEKKDNAILVREQQIQLLNNEAMLKQSSLRNANLVKKFTFAGIGILLLLLLLLVNQYRIKQRNNKIMAQKNQSLEKLVTEKEWLLKEVHHRVKNNLHTVMSLLESQSAYLQNDDALAAMQKSQHRVYAMSLIHQKLYQSENTTSIDMSVYLPGLLDYLGDSFDTGQRIRFNYDIEKIRLDISKAIPAGLILNEAITNAIKHAFPGQRQGMISISMKRIAENRIRLEVSDNGVGLPANGDAVDKNSLGLKLMKGLSEDIHAELQMRSDNGTSVIVDFSEELG